MEEEREIIIANNAVKKFKLEINCEDECEMRHYLMAHQYRNCLYEFNDFIRMIWKHGIPNDIKIQFIWDKFHNILDSNHVELD